MDSTGELLGDMDSIEALLRRLEPEREDERDDWKDALQAAGIRHPKDLDKMGPAAIAACSTLPLYLHKILVDHVKAERSKQYADLPRHPNHVVLACQLNVYYISNVDVINQTFDVDLAIESQLSKDQARTLPIPAKNLRGQCRTDLRKDQDFRAETGPTGQNFKATFDEIMHTPELWDPHFDILNKKHVESSESWATKNVKQTAVYYKSRFKATLFSQFYLGSFPFDQQALRIQLTSSRHPLHNSNGELGLLLIPRPQPSHLLRISTDMLESWDINAEIVHTRVGATPSVHSLSRERHPMIEYLIFVNRKPWHYILNIAVPMFCLASLGLTVYLDPAGDVMSRIEIVMTLILSCVTYQIVISKMLPDIPYFTWLDRYVSMCVGFLILIVLDTVIAHKLKVDVLEDTGDELELTLTADWLITDRGSYIGIANLLMFFLVVHGYHFFQLGMYFFVYR
jgi:hypothetical protein